MHRLLAHLLLAATLGVSASAHAQAAKPGGRQPASAAPKPPPDRADELFEQGAAAYDAGRLQEADAKLEQAWGLKKTYDIAGNLGVVEVRLGKFPQAAEHLAWALEHFPPTESDTARRGYEGEFAKARVQAGALRIQVNVEGAEILVNGRPIGKAPFAGTVFVEPGRVVVEAKLAGYTGNQQAITVPKGEAREVSMVLAPVDEKPEKRSVVPGIVMGSVGGVAIVTGIALVAAGHGKYTTGQTLHDAIARAGNSCVGGADNYDTRCVQIESIAQSSQTLHNAGVGVAVGGALVGGAAIAYLLWPEAAARTRRPVALRILPSASATGGGLVAVGRF